MQKWYQIFPKNTGLSLYIWIIFCVLPFYFIFKSSATFDILIGILMVFLFFIAYRLSFISKSWLVYVWVSIEMSISIFMTLFFGYVYFALFLAFFIGNIHHKVGFFILYGIHLLSTIVTITIGFFLTPDLFIFQLPFIIISLIGVILLPFNLYNRSKREKLEVMLDDANTKLILVEERQRIARDLHDTLGQKLSLIGLKSDLAGKLITSNPKTAKREVADIHQTARVALKEVRELVSNMRGVKLEDELIRIEQMLTAAQMNYNINGNRQLSNIPLLIENVLSMCLKEAVTNVVKHSQASTCTITIKQAPEETIIKVKDDGIGITESLKTFKGHGLRGMKERLEFLNGQLDITSSNGTVLNIRMPNIIQQDSMS